MDDPVPRIRPLWRGCRRPPLVANESHPLGQWVGLGTDKVELKALRFGIRDWPNRQPEPFHLARDSRRPYSEEKKAFVEQTIAKRLQQGTWTELTHVEAENAST